MHTQKQLVMPRSFFVLLFALCGLPLVAQTNSEPLADDRATAAHAAPLIQEDWTIYVDEENQTYFIDFEKFKINLREVIVRDRQGTAVFRDAVGELPVNTIYELDFSAYPKGRYAIELHAYSGMMRKMVDIK